MTQINLASIGIGKESAFKTEQTSLQSWPGLCERGDVTPTVKENEIAIAEMSSRNEASKALHMESEFGIKAKFRLQNGRPFEWLMGAVTTTPGISIDTTTNTITFADADPDTITRANGSWITDGIVVGASVIVSGSTSNDGTYTATIVTATVITLTLTADVLAAESMTTGTLLMSPPYSHAASNSNTVPSYTIEHVINPSGANEYSHKFVGGKCNDLVLTFTKGQPVIGDATFYCGGHNYEDSPGTNTLNTVDPYTFHQATTLNINSVDYKLTARQLVVTMGNNLEREYGLNSRDAESITEGLRKCMISIENYTADDTAIQLMKNRTDFAISIVVTRGTNTITYTASNAKVFEPSWDLGGNSVVDILPIRVIGDWTVVIVDDNASYNN